MRIVRLAGWMAGIAFAALTASANVAVAAGLQISPISISMNTEQKASEVWLRNSSTEVVHAQVRVYHWTQENGDDVLMSEQKLLATPPMVQIEPGQQQLIRLVRVGALTSPSVVEQSYRLLIDELPIKKNTATAGLDFVFRYSVPVFIAGTTPAKHQLEWSLRDTGNEVWLRVQNSGSGHAQLANIEYMPPDGKPVMAANGLAGYVLPGRYRDLMLPLPASMFSQGGVFSSLINAVNVETRVAPIIKIP